jgi:hypothetical protein
MSSEAHIRIDEGIPRGKKKRPGGKLSIKPSTVERQTRDEAGRFLDKYTPELRKHATHQALIAIEAGARVEDVADSNGIPRSTLYSWLIGDIRAQELRTQFFDGQVAASLDHIDQAGTPLDLARARERLSGWVKVAERRDPRNYGIKQEITHTISPVLTINAPAPQQDSQVIDVTPERVEQDR